MDRAALLSRFTCTLSQMIQSPVAQIAKVHSTFPHCGVHYSKLKIHSSGYCKSSVSALYQQKHVIILGDDLYVIR